MWANNKFGWNKEVIDAEQKWLGRQKNNFILRECGKYISILKRGSYAEK